MAQLMPQAEAPPRVAIIGGGVSGLTHARILSKLGFDCIIIEKVRKPPQLALLKRIIVMFSPFRLYFQQRRPLPVTRISLLPVPVFSFVRVLAWAVNGRSHMAG